MRILHLDATKYVKGRLTRLKILAEDEGFEPSIGFPIHAFQACALGRYANPPEGESVSALITMITRRSFVRRHRTELPQGWKAARVGALWRVCEGTQDLD